MDIKITFISEICGSNLKNNLFAISLSLFGAPNKKEFKAKAFKNASDEGNKKKATLPIMGILK